MLRAGFVGLPNTGKTTLFNAVTSQTTADIAGLVRGSSQGEGMGNQFLHAIRETDTMVQVVRCFENEAVVHVDNSIDPRRDMETIQIELALADLATVERRSERVQKTAKSGDKSARAELEVLDKLQPSLEEFQPARSLSFNDEERAIARNYFLLTMKPTIYAANVSESTLSL